MAAVESLRKETELWEIQKEGEHERREVKKKKKPKLPNLECSLLDFLQDHGSQYARKRLHNFEYVKLWYFTPEGCADAARKSQMNAEDYTLFSNNQ